MQVQLVELTGYSDVVHLTAVYGGTTNADDNSFASATPSGTLKLQVDNPDMRGQFKPGMKFYVDLTQIEDAPAAK